MSPLGMIGVLVLGLILFNLFAIWILNRLPKCDHEFEYENYSSTGTFPIKACKKCGQRITTEFGE